MYGQLLGTWGRPERMGDNVGRQVVDDCHDMVALVVEKVHSDGKPGTGWPLAHFHLLLFRPPLRYALKKKTISFGNFSQHGGGVFPNPKTFVNLPSIFLYAKFILRC